MARVAIIADDLTGALDTGSPFACRGFAVRAALDPAAIDAALASGPEILAVTTSSRDLPADRARTLAGQAAARLLPWRPDLVLKKIDSRLKGNIAEETAAVAEAFGFSSIVVAPAVPDQGRLVEEGHVVGRGVDGRLSVAERMPGGFAASVRDAESDEDLDRVAADWTGDGRLLFVGARGLAAAFARRLAVAGTPRPFIAGAPAIVAVGSRDPVTSNQVASLLSARPDATIVEAPGGIPLPRRADGPLTVFACTGDPVEPPASVAKIFARSVAAEVARLKPSTLLLTGGDTALAVLQALGVRTLHVRGEAAAGLPWFEVVGAGGERITVITKSGGFGPEDVLSDVLGRGKAVDGRMAALPAMAQYRE